MLLRDVVADDLLLLFEHQSDAEAARMAAFVPREWEAFFAHWERILADPGVLKQVILCDGEVAGHAVCFERGGLREVGYWVGREHWGRGLASRAVAEIVARVPERPLHALVAAHNAASRRVLEKCGFVLEREEAGAPGFDGEPVVDLVMRLD